MGDKGSAIALIAETPDRPGLGRLELRPAQLGVGRRRNRPPGRNPRWPDRCSGSRPPARWSRPGPPTASRPRARPKAGQQADQGYSGAKTVPDRLPFLSCRCAVIVGTDNIRVGGHWTQPRAVHVGIRLRRRPGFDTQGFFHDFRITPCRGDARRADVLDRARFRAASAAAAIAAAAAPADPEHLWAGRTGQRRTPVLRQRLARARLGDRARGQPMGPAERLRSRRGRLAAPSSPDCATAKARSTPRMPATCGSTGRARRSASTGAATARAP